MIFVDNFKNCFYHILATFLLKKTKEENKKKVKKDHVVPNEGIQTLLG